MSRETFFSSHRDYRISDIALSIAAMLGLELKTNTVGRDRSREMVTGDIRSSLVA